MLIVRHQDGTIERMAEYEMPKVFTAIPAAINEDDAWGVFDDNYDEPTEDHDEIKSSDPIIDKTFSAEAFLKTGTDEPLPDDVIINESDIPKITKTGKKSRR